MSDDAGFEVISEASTFIGDIAEPAVPRARTLPTTIPVRDRDSQSADSQVDLYVLPSAGGELASLVRLGTPTLEPADGPETDLTASEPASSGARIPAVPPSSTSLLSNFRHRARHRRGMPSPVLKP